MIDTQAIRKKILDLALRGKLTEQLPEDGTAEELYQQIQQEKAAMIKAGIIKSGKPLPHVTINDTPCIIPENWKWVRWGNLSEQIQYGYIASAQNTGRIKMVRISDIQGNKVIWENVPYCDIDEETIEIYKLHQNDILFARTGGTVGKSYLVENVDTEAVFAGYLIRTSYSKSLSARYIKYFMDSDLYWKQLQDGTIATAQPNCNGQTLSKMILPLPPAAEQIRIVERIRSIFSILDTIDALQNQYQDNLAALKSKIIDAGIQGKLTEQLPEDGTAEELYQQIQQEKAKLEKAGKIKKSKPLPPVAEEEKPFEIPESWMWVRLENVSNMLAGYAFKSADFKSTGRFRLLRGINLGVNEIRWSDTVYIDSLPKQQLEDYRIKKEDVLFGMDRPWISPGTRVCIYGEEEDSYLVQRVLRIRGICGVSNTFIHLLLSSQLPIESIGNSTTGISVPHVSEKQVGNIPIPLPPLAEQKRIVAKLEELLPLCE